MIWCSSLVNLKQFRETKNALLRYYSSSRASHGVHLIGFTAGLFTLIQTVQHSRQEPLSEIFSNVGAILFEITRALGVHGIALSIGEIIKLGVLSFGIGFLLFFIFHTIFRFAVFANFSDYLIGVKPTEISKRTEPIHEAIHSVVTDNICTRDKKRFYGRIPISWFIVREKDSEHQNGYKMCGILAIVSTLILMGLLW